jgi:hypothetical protein
MTFVPDATLQNLINKHTIDLENIERNKKREKGEFIRCLGRCQNLSMLKINHL